MLEHFLEEIDGALTYYDLYLEHENHEIGRDLYYMSLDELRHADFWLGLMSFTKEYNEKYQEIYDDACKKIHGGCEDVRY
jgi:hypothetical protein